MAKKQQGKKKQSQRRKNKAKRQAARIADYENRRRLRQGETFEKVKRSMGVDRMRG